MSGITLKKDGVMKITAHDDAQTKTFTLYNEDHTLGTTLTYVLDKLPETDFCAYTIGHPQDNAIYIRLKVKPGHNPFSVFDKGLRELKKLLVLTKVVFQNALDQGNEYMETYT